MNHSDIEVVREVEDGKGIKSIKDEMQFNEMLFW